MTEVKTLHQTLIEELGKRTIERTEIPDAIISNLNPAFTIRPYQTRALQLFLNYWQEAFDGKPRQNHQLLFHMATGSGKTFIMAGLMLHLYTQGYRNFLFFVNSTNIIDKTRNNFQNPLSGKFLFAQQLSLGDKQFAVREVDNFQSTNPDDINIVFSTIQGLHLDLNTPRENGLTYDDFENQKIVLISDEAHHINASTKKGSNLSQEELFEDMSWEGTVQRIFEANPDNVLLEFTATIDFSDENLAAKYKPRLIYDYTLKEFRKDGYSKEVKVLQADLPPFERALQAVLLSQYRRKIFEKNRLSIKPVILFKSKTIKESKDFLEHFKTGMETLTAAHLAEAQRKAEDPALKSLFAYLAANNITLENLAIELRGDFSEDKLIEVNSKEESEANQIAVNSLEDTTNEFRAVFAVDKLNEGWDVLNLFDIVRLYDTRDGKAGKIGKTTMSEAQLIGRGARYCPFIVSPDQPLDQRKYDADLTHEMRVCEELIYHSAYNPKYIQELNTALHEIGIKSKDSRQRSVKLKQSFKDTPLYKAGHLFLNGQQKYDRSDITGLDNSLIQKLYKMQLHTGHSQSNTVFEAQNGRAGIERKQKDYALSEFGAATIRKAMQKLEFYEFKNLKSYLPNLKSVQEFMTDESYIGKIRVEVSGTPEQVENLTAADKLQAAVQILTEISAVVASDKVEYKGTKEFKPFMIKDRITDKTLNFAADEGEDQEFGRSMNDAAETAIHLDLTTRDWFVFDDCFGTSEEKLLIKFIDKHYNDLKKKFSDVYLIRNERHFKIYNFDDGRPLEPDFILYLIGREESHTMHYQVFIEPKGGHLLKQDEWKEKFLMRLQAESVIEQLWGDRKFAVWGLPFFNSTLRVAEFDTAFESVFD